MHAIDNLQVGTIFINRGIVGYIQGYHSGHKMSGLGGEDGSSLGATLGTGVGSCDGFLVGSSVLLAEGDELGLRVGCRVGISVGNDVTMLKLRLARKRSQNRRSSSKAATDFGRMERT